MIFSQLDASMRKQPEMRGEYNGVVEAAWREQFGEPSAKIETLRTVIDHEVLRAGNYTGIGDESQKLIAVGKFKPIFRGSKVSKLLNGINRNIESASAFYLIDLDVEPNHQGRGLGKAALTKIVELYATSDYYDKEFITDVVGDNAIMHGWMRRLGLVQTELSLPPAMLQNGNKIPQYRYSGSVQQIAKKLLD